jgi:hypothetical protein
MLPCIAVADVSWQAYTLDWRTSPVDLSFLNAGEKPAGKRGFLRAKQDRLLFEDGTMARFWGTNLTAAALFGTTRENTKQQARRLSEIGFNLVRIHLHDSEWVTPNIFGLPGSRARPDLDPAMLDKLDWWIKCLKDEGIYVWLDLHVGRRIQAGEGLAGLDEILREGAGSPVKGYAYVNDDIRATVKRLKEAYVEHRNGHTGLQHKDEPPSSRCCLPMRTTSPAITGTPCCPARVFRGTARLHEGSRSLCRRQRIAREHHFASLGAGSVQAFF